jgi:hypothetical protein
MLVPALLMRMSSRPNRSSVACTMAWTDALLATSTPTATACAPSAASSSTACALFSGLRAATTIEAPA